MLQTPPRSPRYSGGAARGHNAPLAVAATPPQVYAAQRHATVGAARSASSHADPSAAIVVRHPAARGEAKLRTNPTFFRPRLDMADPGVQARLGACLGRIGTSPAPYVPAARAGDLSLSGAAAIAATRDLTASVLNCAATSYGDVTLATTQATSAVTLRRDHMAPEVRFRGSLRPTLAIEKEVHWRRLIASAKQRRETELAERNRRVKVHQEFKHRAHVQRMEARRLAEAACGVEGADSRGISPHDGPLPFDAEVVDHVELAPHGFRSSDLAQFVFAAGGGQQLRRHDVDAYLNAGAIPRALGVAAAAHPEAASATTPAAWFERAVAAVAVGDPTVERQHQLSRSPQRRGSSPQPMGPIDGTNGATSSMPSRAPPPRPQGGAVPVEPRSLRSTRGSVASASTTASDKSYAARMRMAASVGSGGQPPSRGSFSSRTSKPMR